MCSFFYSALTRRQLHVLESLEGGGESKDEWNKKKVFLLKRFCDKDWKKKVRFGGAIVTITCTFPQWHSTLVFPDQVSSVGRRNIFQTTFLRFLHATSGTFASMGLRGDWVGGDWYFLNGTGRATGGIITPACCVFLGSHAKLPCVPTTNRCSLMTWLKKNILLKVCTRDTALNSVDTNKLVTQWKFTSCMSASHNFTCFYTNKLTWQQKDPVVSMI